MAMDWERGPVVISINDATCLMTLSRSILVHGYFFLGYKNCYLKSQARKKERKKENETQL